MSENKIKNITVLASKTLESTEATTEAATSRKIVDSYYSEQINITCKYTTGTAETGTNCYVKVWGYVGQATDDNNFPYTSAKDVAIAGDSTNWIQLGTYENSSGTCSFTPALLKIAGGAGATSYTAHFAFGITFSKIRVSAYETGVSSNKGILTCVVSVQ